MDDNNLLRNNSTKKVHSGFEEDFGFNAVDGKKGLTFKKHVAPVFCWKSIVPPKYELQTSIVLNGDETSQSNVCIKNDLSSGNNGEDYYAFD